MSAVVAARVQFDAFAQGRYTLRKFLVRPDAFPEDVSAITEQSMKARVCEPQARDDFRLFRIGGESIALRQLKGQLRE